MFSVNLKLSKKRTFFILVAFVTVAVSAIVFRVEGYKEDLFKPIQCSGETDIREYLSSFGVELGQCVIDEIIVPCEFSDVYNNYNKIQQEQGFDLADYKGKTVIRYTFSILNHPDSQNVFAEVLTFEKNVVGADIYSTELDGFISPLK